MTDGLCHRWVEELTRVTFRKTYPWLLVSATSSKNLKRLRKGALSLCMIVKNEADNLEKCLSLARPHVEEIVIVDTGSTDGTQEIA
ncbi:MAG: glycosyltransferase, partial [Lysobacterales bacterium]